MSSSNMIKKKVNICIMNNEVDKCKERLVYLKIITNTHFIGYCNKSNAKVSQHANLEEIFLSNWLLL